MTPSVNPMSLEGRTIIVTGGAQGIGRAVADLVIALGGKVVAADMNAEALEQAESCYPDGSFTGAKTDISDPIAVQNLVDSAVAKYGAVHGLVNNAGIIRPAMIEKMTLAQWNEVIAVHLTGAFLCTQAVGRHMIERIKHGDENPGSIVFISSDAGVQGAIGQINYVTAKAGVLGAAMSAAREWGKYGIRANSVAFGVVETSMTETIRGERFRDTYMARIPLERFSSPDEAARPVCFLLSDASSFITGQRISANGGMQISV